jgi:hypothetical protein
MTFTSVNQCGHQIFKDLANTELHPGDHFNPRKLYA